MHDYDATITTAVLACDQDLAAEQSNPTRRLGNHAERDIEFDVSVEHIY